MSEIDIVKILGPAIRYNEITLIAPIPFGHDHCLSELGEMEFVGLDPEKIEMGFYTNNARFVDRQSASRIAFLADQIDDGTYPLTSEVLKRGKTK